MVALAISWNLVRLHRRMLACSFREPAGRGLQMPAEGRRAPDQHPPVFALRYCRVVMLLLSSLERRWVERRAGRRARNILLWRTYWEDARVPSPGAVISSGTHLKVTGTVQTPRCAAAYRTIRWSSEGEKTPPLCRRRFVMIPVVCPQ